MRLFGDLDTTDGANGLGSLLVKVNVMDCVMASILPS